MPISWVTDEDLDCWEVFGTQTMTFDFENGVTASVELRCPWADRYEVMKGLRGLRWPYTETGNCFCHMVQEKPYENDQHAADGSGFTYQVSTLIANFKSTTSELVAPPGEEDPEPEDLVLYRKQFSSVTDFITIDPYNLIYANGRRVPAHAAPGRRMSGRKLTTIWESLQAELDVEDYVGTVNSVAIGSYDVGTLLFIEENASQTVTTMEDGLWTHALSFAYRPTGWQKVWHPETGWAKLEEFGGGPINLFDETDFSDFVIV